MVDNWNTSLTPTTPQDATQTQTYTAYRIDNLYGSPTSLGYNNFAKQYRALYHLPPKEQIGFLTYQTVMSFVTALKNFPPPKKLSTQQAILWSYHRALKTNPNWFRPMDIAIYRLEGKQEILFKTIR